MPRRPDVVSTPVRIARERIARFRFARRQFVFVHRRGTDVVKLAPGIPHRVEMKLFEPRALDYKKVCEILKTTGDEAKALQAGGPVVFFFCSR